jgi:integrase
MNQSTKTTMNTLFDKYEAEYVPELEPRTQRDYKAILVMLRQVFGAMATNEVKPRHVADFINVKKGRIHRNRMVTILSTVFKIAMGSWCIDEDLVNPCTVVKRWATKPRERYVTDDEFRDFRATCPPPIQIAMDLALLTGQRQGDIVGMKWDQVKTPPNRADWEIWIDQGKTGKKLAISISPAIEMVLKRARLLAPVWPREYVLRTNQRGDNRGTGYTMDGFRAMWQRCMRKWVAAGHENFHYHDIRAKSISDNPVLENAYLLSGHMDKKLTRRVYDRNRRRVEALR